MRRRRWSLSGKYWLVPVALVALLVGYELVAPGIKVGQRYHLQNHNLLWAQPGATVFASEADLATELRARDSNVRFGPQGATGTGFSVRSGTTVLILRSDYVDSERVYNVLILDCGRAGTTVWLPEGAIVPSENDDGSELTVTYGCLWRQPGARQ